MRRPILKQLLSLVPALGLAVACSSGGDGGPGPGPSASIALSLSAGNGSVVQGGSTTLTGTLTRGGGYAGTVNFTVEGAPAGVTGAVSNIQTSGTTTTATITIQTSLATPAGSSTLTVRAAGSGVDPKTQPFELTVTAAPEFSLAVNPAAASVVQGLASAAIPVTISRTNFSGAVTLGLTGAPAGVTAAFTPPSPTDNTSSMTITVAPSVPLGVHSFQISGTGTPGTRNTAFALTVTAPGSFTLALVPAGAVTVFQGAADNSKTVQIARTNYPVPITLTAENLPTGVTASFAGNPVSGTSSVLTLTAGATAAPGNHTITIRGTGPLALRGPGAIAAVDATTTLAVTIATLGSFGMSLSLVCPLAITLSQGELDDSRVITFTRTNFPAGIQLTAEGLPAGMTATFSPNPALGNTARMSLTAGPSTPVGNYTVTVRGTGPASLKAPGAPAAIQATVTLPIAVTAETPDLLDVDYTFNSDLEHWLPGGSCSFNFGPDWGAAFWNNGIAQFDGVGNIGEPNAWISKLQTVPLTASLMQFDVAGFVFPGSDARLRVRIVDGGVSTVLFDQVIVGGVDPPVMATKTVSIAPWAGKTVRIFFEQDATGGAHEQILLDNIRILSGLGSAWQYRKPISIATDAAAAPAGYSIMVQLDHAALVTAGKSLASGDDVRIVYSNGTVSYELDRRRERVSAFNTANTRVWFATQAPIGANETNGHYYLYYGNPAAGIPPTNRLKIFLFEDDFENGNLNRWSQFPAAAWVADNSRAHDGTFSVKYPAEAQGGKVMLPNFNINTADVYVESWWYLDSPSTAYKMNLQLRNQTNGNVYQANLNAPPFGWGIGKLINPTFTQLVTTPSAPPVGSWIRVGAGIHGSTMRLFVNGTEVAVTSGLTELGAGQVGLGKFEIPAGASWWVDDFVTRRYTFPEPGNTLGSEQAGPFAAAMLGLQRSGGR